MSESESALEVKLGAQAVAVAFVQLAKRVGLAKTVMGLAMRQMFSEKTKRKAFAGYAPTAHDVFVATFGKSGTNWMMQIAQQIAWYGDAEFRHIHERVPWPDSPGPGLVELDDLSALDGCPTGLRVIKTHLETEFVPYSEEAKYLTIIRDPKEVAVSGYWFLGGIFGVLSHLSFDDWFDLVTRSDSLMETWAVHTASFWAWRDRPNVLVLDYGEVKKEPVRSIQRVAAVMGVELTNAELDKVVERASFAYMKAHESQFAPPKMPFTGSAPPAKMIRRGETGASEELLTRAQQAEIDRRCQAELAKLGSDFPYASLFDVVTDA